MHKLIAILQLLSVVHKLRFNEMHELRFNEMRRYYELDFSINFNPFHKFAGLSTQMLLTGLKYLIILILFDGKLRFALMV